MDKFNDIQTLKNEVTSTYNTNKFDSQFDKLKQADKISPFGARADNKSLDFGPSAAYKDMQFKSVSAIQLDKYHADRI